MYNVNDVFRFTVCMMSGIGVSFAGRMKGITSTSVCNVVACKTVVFASKRTMGWVICFCVGLRSLALTSKSLRLLVRRTAKRGVALKTLAQRGG